MTNEPTDACEIVTNELTVAAAVGLESPIYMDAIKQTSTIEPTQAELANCRPTTKIRAGINNGDDREEAHRQKAVEGIRVELARTAAFRAEKYEQSRKEAKEAYAARRARRRAWRKNGKPADQPQHQAVATKSRTA